MSPTVQIKESGERFEWANCDTPDCENLVFIAAALFHGVQKCFPCAVKVLGQERCEYLRDMRQP